MNKIRRWFAAAVSGIAIITMAVLVGLGTFTAEQAQIFYDEARADSTGEGWGFFNPIDKDTIWSVDSLTAAGRQDSAATVFYYDSICYNYNDTSIVMGFFMVGDHESQHGLKHGMLIQHLDILERLEKDSLGNPIPGTYTEYVSPWALTDFLAVLVPRSIIAPFTDSLGKIDPSADSLARYYRLDIDALGTQLGITGFLDTLTDTLPSGPYNCSGVVWPPLFKRAKKNDPAVPNPNRTRNKP